MESTRTPSPRVTTVASLAAVLACVLAGPFGTQVLPLPARALFWLLLIGWNSAKWWGWYSWVGERAEGRQGAITTAVLGAVLLNALLPAEIETAYRLVGMPLRLDWWALFVQAVLISASISAIAVVLRTPRAAHSLPGQQVAAPPTERVPPLATRARIADLSDIRLVLAEDHYLRLVLADGRQPLLLHRFGDALEDLAPADGLQVSRSAWVASAMVRGAVRDGRRWKLVLHDGREVPVSASHLARVRARGWLRPTT